MRRFPAFLALPLALFAAAAASFAESTAGTQKPLTEKEISSASFVEALTLPSAGEFFAALSKAGRAHWSAAGRAVTSATTTDRPQIALNLGVLIADGYLAIENQSSQSVKNVGRDLLDAARKLNAGENVVGRGRSIADFAETNDWNSLREEMDATQNEIKLSLIEQKDESLVILVSLGAWLRSLQVASTLVGANFTEPAAALLEQSALAGLFVKKLDALPERIRSRELLVVVRDQTALLQTAMDTADGRQLTPGAVQEIGEIAAVATARIAGAKPPGPPPPAPASGSEPQEPSAEPAREPGGGTTFPETTAP